MPSMLVRTVKIIHTSDWHIGRTFEGAPMADEQRQFLDWLARQVVEHGVDLVLVAGDIYDRSLPAEEATFLLDEGLDGLIAAGAEVVLIPGNHDGALRLGFGSNRQRLSGVHVMGGSGSVHPWRWETGGGQVALVSVPYLDPYTAPLPRPGPDGSHRSRTHQHVLEDALDDARESLVALRRATDQPLPAIAVAHAFVAGSEESDSERTLSIGGTDRVDAAVFAGFDYVALGHLHRPQRVGGTDAMAYSGSPLPYSFSEVHPKSVRLLDLGPTGLEETTLLPVPVGRPVVTLEGTLDDLLENPAYDTRVDHWVSAVLTDATVQTQPMERLRRRFPHIASVRYAAGISGPGVGSPEPVDIEEEPADAVVLAFLADALGDRLTPGGRALVLDAVNQAIREAGR